MTLPRRVDKAAVSSGSIQKMRWPPEIARWGGNPWIVGQGVSEGERKMSEAETKNRDDYGKRLDNGVRSAERRVRGTSDSASTGDATRVPEAGTAGTGGRGTSDSASTASAPPFPHPTLHQIPQLSPNFIYRPLIPPNSPSNLPAPHPSIHLPSPDSSLNRFVSSTSNPQPQPSKNRSRSGSSSDCSNSRFAICF